MQRKVDPERLWLAAGPKEFFNLALGTKAANFKEPMRVPRAVLQPLPFDDLPPLQCLLPAVQRISYLVHDYYRGDLLPPLWLVADCARLMCDTQRAMYLHPTQSVQTPAFLGYTVTSVLEATLAKTRRIVKTKRVQEAERNDSKGTVYYRQMQKVPDRGNAWRQKVQSQAETVMHMPPVHVMHALWVLTNPSAVEDLRRDSSGFAEAVYGALPAVGGSLLDKMVGVLPAKWAQACDTVHHNIVTAFAFGALPLGKLGTRLPLRVGKVFPALFNACCDALAEYVADSVAEWPGEPDAAFPPSAVEDFLAGKHGQRLAQTVRDLAAAGAPMHCAPPGAPLPSHTLTEVVHPPRVDARSFDCSAYFATAWPTLRATEAAIQVFRWGALPLPVWTRYLLEILVRFALPAPDLVWHLPEKHRAWFVWLRLVLTGADPAAAPFPEQARPPPWLLASLEGSLKRSLWLWEDAPKGALHAAAKELVLPIQLHRLTLRLPHVMACVELHWHTQLGDATHLNVEASTMGSLARLLAAAWHDPRWGTKAREWLLHEAVTSLMWTFQQTDAGFSDSYFDNPSDQRYKELSDTLVFFCAPSVQDFVSRRPALRAQVARDVVDPLLRRLRRCGLGLLWATRYQLQCPAQAGRAEFLGLVSNPEVPVPQLAQAVANQLRVACPKGRPGLLGVLDCLVQPRVRRVYMAGRDDDLKQVLILVAFLLASRPEPSVAGEMHTTQVLLTVQWALRALLNADTPDVADTVWVTDLAQQVQGMLVARKGVSFDARVCGPDVPPRATTTADWLPRLRDRHEAAIRSMTAAPRGHSATDVIGGNELLPQGVTRRRTRNREDTFHLADPSVPYGVERPAQRQRTSSGTWVDRFALTTASGRVRWDELRPSTWCATGAAGAPLQSPSQLACSRTLITNTGATCYIASALNVLFACATTQDLLVHMLLAANEAEFRELAGPLPSYFALRADMLDEDSENDDGDADDGTAPSFNRVFLMIALRVLCRSAASVLPVTQLLEALGSKHRKRLVSSGGQEELLIVEILTALGFTCFVTDDACSGPHSKPPVPVDFVLTVASTFSRPDDFYETLPAQTLTAGPSSYVVLGGTLILAWAEKGWAHSLELLRCPDDGDPVIHDPNFCSVIPFDWLHKPLGRLGEDASWDAQYPRTFVHARHLLYVNQCLDVAIRTGASGHAMGARALVAALTGPSATV